MELLNNGPSRPKHTEDWLRAISSVSLKAVCFVSFYFVKLSGQNPTVIFMETEGSFPYLQQPTTEAYPAQNKSIRFLSQHFLKL